MLFETWDNKNNLSFKALQIANKNAVFIYHFCWRIAKDCLFRFWNNERTQYVDCKVVSSFTNMVDNSKNIIHLKKAEKEV